MKHLVLPMLLVLAACGESPFATRHRPDIQSAAVQKSSSITTVSARTQVVSLQFIPGGETAEATFKARFSASTDPSAQMDGAILVVSALDGPMPVIGGESLAIEITQAVIDASGMIQFGGSATVRSGRVVLDRYAITGSAQAAAVARGEYIVWDIVGGNSTWEMRFSALTKLTS